MSNFLSLFDLGGGEIVLMLALILLLFGARHLPGISRGLIAILEHKRNAFDPRNWLKWSPVWADLITILLITALGMVILTLFVP